ncbi:FUSC family protein [Bradyrhizobium tropiciagri]|uniref:FUSC family protein n=1 Tax=Bradyrhizobium tropiciagri TaxID=312253 RepID=UPI001BAD42CD|nr:FUSC family protein [Bradyrhizobium tropiciagri]MBR0875006.1 FUSC family protein [Bradyrhizobium tropiciagri]
MAVDQAPIRELAKRELRNLFSLDARLVDELECTFSVLLAILFAHAIGVANVSWAAYSGYMVMRGHVAESTLRGVLRILGTCAGAGIAVVLTPLVLDHVTAQMLASAAIGGTMLYAALTARRAYAWLFVGITFEMILLDKVQHRELAVTTFALTRVAEVIAGTSACVIVSALSTLTARRYWPAPAPAAVARFGWHPDAARHAAQGAIALGVLPCLALLGLPELSQSSITILAVMLVPVASVGRSGLVPVSRRLLYRTLGCVAGCLFAALVLFASSSHASVVILILGTLVGVIVGRHIENGGTAIAYAGTQFVLVVLVALVPDSYAQMRIDPALERLSGILMGLVVLEPVLLAWHLVAPSREPPREQAASTNEGE